MKLNSDRAIAAGRALYAKYDRDWSKVANAGFRRPDGIIEINMTRPSKLPTCEKCG